VVVGIGDHKGTVEERRRHQDRLPGAPRLAPVIGPGETLGQRIELLAGVKDLGAGGRAAIHVLPDLGLGLAADHDHHPPESRVHRVEDRVVHQGRPAGAHRIELLEPAVAGADAGRENHKCHFHRSTNPSRSGSSVAAIIVFTVREHCSVVSPVSVPVSVSVPESCVRGGLTSSPTQFVGHGDGDGHGKETPC